MRLWSVPPLLALLCALWALPTLRGAADPGGLFLQAYQSYQDAERSEAAGNTADALQKFRSCANVLGQIQKENPGYEPIVIDFRLRKSRESIARVQSLAMPAPTAFAPATEGVSVAAPVPASPPAGGLRFPQFSTSYRIPVPGASSPASPPVETVVAGRSELDETTDQVIGRGAINALKDRIRSLELRISEEKGVSADLNRKLLESTAREQMALTEVDRTKVQNVEMKGRLDQSNQSLADLRQTNERMSGEKQADERRIAGLESDLEAAHADLEVADEFNGELSAKLERAARFIDASEKIRTQLLSERKELSGRASAKSSELGSLKRERDAAVAKAEEMRKRPGDSSRLAAENKDLAAKFASAEQQILDVAKNRSEQEKAESGLREEISRLQQEREVTARKATALQGEVENSAALAKQNQELAAKLSAAEQQMAVATKTRDEREKMADGLRGELDAVTKTLASMKGQLVTGTKRIDELEKQLAETASATAATTGAMADENALLKSLVTRQLSEQARRQQARKLVAEEMEKLQVRSTALVGKLDALGKAETELTPREKKLFEQPVPGNGSGTDFSLVIAKSQPASDLPEDLANRAKEANQLAQRGRLADSRAIYEEIERKAPRSYIAAINLGITERRLGNYPQAVTAFRRALALKPGDAFTLTNLGGAQFRGGNLGDSLETLEKAVAADPGDYLSHYMFALALNEKGDLDGARREVGHALDLKPDYLPAVQLGGELGKPTNAKNPPVGGTGVPR